MRSENKFLRILSLDPPTRSKPFAEAVWQARSRVLGSCGGFVCIVGHSESAKMVGVRSGNWLSLRQAQALLSAPDITSVRGLRDRAVLTVLLGCGLRRSEVAALTFEHVQQRDGRWCIVDLVGKHGRVRTVPVPAWTKVAIDAWT